MKEQEKFEEAKRDYSVLEFSQRESKKKRRTRSLLLLIFNVLVIGIIIIVEVTGNNQKVPIGDVLKTWGKNWKYIVMLFAVVTIMFLALGLRFYALIKAMTGRRRLRLSLSTAILGKYYDYVTPFGTGGQPFQMFNLGRKLDVGLATSLPVAAYIVHEFVCIVIQIVVFCTTSYVMKGKQFMEIAAYIGLVAFAAAPIAILLFSLFPKAITKVARFICKVGHKLHLVKDVEKAEQKAISGVQRYSQSLKLICKKWRALIVIIILSAVYSWGFNSIPYLVLKACGIENISYIETVSMSYYVYSAITIIPTPGGAGAAEISFTAIFKPLTGPYLFWGMLLWRFFVYYITLIIGFSVTVYQYIHAARKDKRESRLALQMQNPAPPLNADTQAITPVDSVTDAQKEIENELTHENNCQENSSSADTDFAENRN